MSVSFKLWGNVRSALPPVNLANASLVDAIISGNHVLKNAYKKFCFDICDIDLS